MDNGRRPIPAPVPGSAAATSEFSGAERRKPRGTGFDEERATRTPQSPLMEWTDEKHNLYLNSMEASFIKQLYSMDCGSRNPFGWLPTMTQKDMHAYGSSSNYMLYGQMGDKTKSSRKIHRSRNDEVRSPFVFNVRWISSRPPDTFALLVVTDSMAYRSSNDVSSGDGDDDAYMRIERTSISSFKISTGSSLMEFGFCKDGRAERKTKAC
ncbi:hypothetical protein MUK42_12635 [Musa troglodytarum]|uniref:Uncharacterized protein n=1 Tax=Musa troglodytarum TaxID=320322 RepID=A0A9E7GLM6_9LILI|nr:hypothetical protein MUK42_12635 [Musa troglodytarum]